MCTKSENQCYERRQLGSHQSPLAIKWLQQVIRDDKVIEAPGTESLKVERNKLEAQATEDCDQSRAKLGLNEPWQISQRYLDPCHITLVITNSKAPQALLAQPLLGLVDHLHALGCDLLTISNAAGKARRRGLVPGWQTPRPGQCSDVGLAQSTLLERMAHLVLSSRLHTRPVVA